MARSSQILDSGENSLFMQELEPSPVDESPKDAEKGAYFPLLPTAPQRSSTLGLGGHNTAWWLLRIQRYSSYTFTIFLALHIPTTSLIPLATQSVSSSEPYLLLTRPYYQSPLLEPAIIALPLALHIGSGLALRLHRRYQFAKLHGAESRAERHNLKGAWPKLSGTSALGYALVPLVAAHAAVNRVLPLLVEGGSSSVGLGYVSHGFAKMPGLAWMLYVGLVSVASCHVVWGWGKWIGWTPDQASGGDSVDIGLKRKRRWYGLNGGALGLAGLWIAGGLGIVGRGGEIGGWVGRVYDELYRKIPVLGQII